MKYLLLILLFAGCVDNSAMVTNQIQANDKFIAYSFRNIMSYQNSRDLAAQKKDTSEALYWQKLVFEETEYWKRLHAENDSLAKLLK